MKSRQPAPRKDARPARLLTIRSALILALAVLSALGCAGLLYLAYRPPALIVLGAVGVFAAAVKLLDSLIELRARCTWVELSESRRPCRPVMCLPGQ